MTGQLEQFFYGSFGEQLTEDAIATVRSNPGSVVNKASEHEFAMLVLLCELGSAVFSKHDQLPDLTALIERFRKDSVLYSGRILPRVVEAIGLLRDALAQQSTATLIEVCDHVSQGWPDYSNTVFPTAFWRLSQTVSPDIPIEKFRDTSYVLWLRGLAAARDADTEQAYQLLERSLRHYRSYDYYADTAWLYADLIMMSIILGVPERAAEYLEEQRSYVKRVLRERGASNPSTGREAFHFGDVYSGRYQTFVEQVVLREPVLRDEDAGLLWRYVRVGEFLLNAARWQSVTDLQGALDRFSNGWKSFLGSSYPCIFDQVAHASLGENSGTNVYLPADALWRHILLTYRRTPSPMRLSAAFQQLEERLRHAGLLVEIDVLRLDTTLLTWALHGRDTAVEWCAPHVEDLRQRIPSLVSPLVDALNARPEDTSATAALAYFAERTKYAAPEFTSMLELLGNWHHHGGAQNRVEVSLNGKELFVDGFRIYVQCPPALRDILVALKRDLDQGRRQRECVPYLRAGDLAARTGRPASALTQAVHRFRVACSDVIGNEINQETVFQGRPGYRLNPDTVDLVTIHPASYADIL